MTALRRTVVHVPSAGRQLFALLSEPEMAPKGIVVHVPAFAEEMNKSRRMLTLATEGFVQDGWAVMQFDLSGCGDSSELLEGVDWDIWVEDLGNVLEWCRCRFPDLSIVLWALRGGALIVSDWLAKSGQACPLLLWQPVLSGKLQLTQFLRLKAANDMLSDADARNVMAELRARIEGGQSVDVAGYRLSARLAQGMSRAVFGVANEGPGQIAVLEIGAPQSTTLSPVIQKAVATWSIGDRRVFAEKIVGAAFWSTQYIEIVPGLFTASRCVLEQFEA